jgi:hypothetical protein
MVPTSMRVLTTTPSKRSPCPHSMSADALFSRTHASFHGPHVYACAHHSTRNGDATPTLVECRRFVQTHTRFQISWSPRLCVCSPLLTRNDDAPSTLDECRRVLHTHTRFQRSWSPRLCVCSPLLTRNDDAPPTLDECKRATQPAPCARLVSHCVRRISFFPRLCRFHSF